MNDDALLIAQLEDRAIQAEDRYMITSGNFLDAHQRKVAEDFCKGRRLSAAICFYGGYEEAERCIPVFLPDYIPKESYASEADVQNLLRVIRVTTAKGGRKLTHRDYLGSLLSLGIDREVTGDILVRDEDSDLGPGADIIVLSGIADFIEMNYAKAGHTHLSVSALPIGNLHVEPSNVTERSDTVASLRLDSVAASAFRLSRAKAAEAIRRGLVTVNSIEALKPDLLLEEGDKVVLRGKGRIILSETGAVTRKDRIRVTYQVYR